MLKSSLKMKAHDKILFLVAFITFLNISCSSTSAQDGVVEISAEKVKTLIKEDINLVDVRTPGEYSQGKIGEAILINYRDKSFREEVGKLDREKPILVYCARGGRSSSAAETLKEMGFSTVYNYGGGFQDWKSRGEEIEN